MNGTIQRRRLGRLNITKDERTCTKINLAPCVDEEKREDSIATIRGGIKNYLSRHLLVNFVSRLGHSRSKQDPNVVCPTIDLTIGVAKPTREVGAH